MIKLVKPEELEIGMFVILDLSWFRHPFSKSQFIITSEKQIARIIETDVKAVKVDASRSVTPDDEELDAPATITESEPATDESPVETQGTTDEDDPAAVKPGKGGFEEAPSEQKKGTDWVAAEKPGHEFVDSDFNAATIDKKNEGQEYAVDLNTVENRGKVEYLDDDSSESLAMASVGESVLDSVAPGVDFSLSKIAPGPMATLAYDLVESINDENLPPQAKADAIYAHSMNLMDSILKAPDKSNLRDGKAIIHKLVDFILSDYATADQLSVVLKNDAETYMHSVNVGILTTHLTKVIYPDMNRVKMRELGTGYFLHDIGKTKVPTHILNKPDKLLDGEWALVRRHPAYGEKILRKTDLWTEESSDIILHHHEKSDGSGYPLGLTGDRISHYAQICHMVDTFDAMTSIRTYREYTPMSSFESLQTIKHAMVNEYNKDVFDGFISIFSR